MARPRAQGGNSGPFRSHPPGSPGVGRVKRSGVADNKMTATSARAEDPEAAHYRLKLFITGTTPRLSPADSEHPRHFAQENLPGRYKLEVIDIYQHAELVATEQIVVTPTLVKQFLSVRKLIGDLSDTERVCWPGLTLSVRSHWLSPWSTNMPHEDTSGSAGAHSDTAKSPG